MNGLTKEDRPDKRIPVGPDVPKTAILDADISPKMFLRERSGLEKEELQGHRTTVSGGDQNAATKDHDENTNILEIQSPKENSWHQLPENGNILLPEDSYDKDVICTRKVSPEQNQIQRLYEHRVGLDIIDRAAALVPENTNGVLQENLPGSALISSEKERSYFSEKEQVSCLGKVTRGVDIDGQNLNSNDEQSLGQNSTPILGNEPRQDPSGRILSFGDEEVSNLAKGTLVHDLLGGINFVDDGDGYECVALKRLKKCSIDDEIQHDLSHCSSGDRVIPEEAELVGHHEDNSIKVSKVDRACNTNPGISSGNDGKRDKAPSFDSDIERIIADEKQRFLNSQNMFNQDSQDTTGWTQGSFCMKCYKWDDQLLTCSNCPIAIHGSCLGSSISVNDSADFYCPFCLYIAAIAAYRETKKKAALVKKKMSLSRNQLSEFLCMLNEQRQQQHKHSEVTRDEELIKNQKEVEDQEIVEPCTSHQSDDIPQREVEETTLKCENTLKVKEIDKVDVNEDRPSEVKERKKRVKTYIKSKTTVKSASSRSAKSASVPQEHAGVEKEIEDWRYISDRRRGRSSQRNVNAYEVFENQNEDRISPKPERHDTVATQQ